MAFFMVAGNLTSEITLFMFPKFNVAGMHNTNLFWLSGMFFFAIGYILKSAKSHNYSQKLIVSSKKQIFVLFYFSIFASIYSVIKLGFIPILDASTGNERFFSQIGSTRIIIIFWQWGVVSSILAVIYYLNIRRDNKLLVVAISSFACMTLFFVRIYPALIVVAVGLFILNKVQNKFKLILTTVIAIPLFLSVNANMMDYRSDFKRSENVNSNVSVAQTSIVSFSDDYTVLNNFLRDYNKEYYYGSTFLTIPIAFIPSPILQVFGINKIDFLQKNSSARITAKFFQRDVDGLRIGIMGELFLNFGYYGSILMLLLGVLTRKVQEILSNLNKSDVRIGYCYLFFSILLYTIDAQLDMVGVLVADYTILMLISKPFLNKKVIIHEQ